MENSERIINCTYCPEGNKCDNPCWWIDSLRHPKKWINLDPHICRGKCEHFDEGEFYERTYSHGCET